MANPLKAMMGGSPIMNQIPRKPQEMAMNLLKQRNPQGYQMLQQMMSSGRNPQDILKEMTSKMSPQQIEQIRQMASQFGIR